MQCVGGADGGFDDFTIVDAGSLSARAFGMAGVLVGAPGGESRFYVDGWRGGIGSLQRWSVVGIARVGKFDSIAGGVGDRRGGLDKDWSRRERQRVDVRCYFLASLPGRGSTSVELLRR